MMYCPIPQHYSILFASPVPSTCMFVTFTELAKKKFPGQEVKTSYFTAKFNNAANKKEGEKTVEGERRCNGDFCDS